jgi:hypothetical protein
MPEIYIHAVKGRTLDQKRAREGHHRRGGEEFLRPGRGRDGGNRESEPTAKAKGGVLFSEMRR